MLLTDVGAADGEDRPDWELDSCGERSELMSIIGFDMDLKTGEEESVASEALGKVGPRS